ncbi:MAG: hypothetical protein AAB495_00080 [Patescibacteria group bacterium]
MRNAQKKILYAAAILAISAIMYLAVTVFKTAAFVGPSSSSTSTSGAVIADTSANIIIGTTTNPGDTRLLVAATSTGASSTIYSIRIIDAGNTSIFNVRNDGRVTIATATFPPTASTTRLRVGGSIESTTGGFIFPDGTTQTTAVSAAATSTVLAANVSAGAFGANTGGGNYTFPASVGIGTTTAPSYALHVVGSAAASAVGIRSTSATGYPGIEYIDSAGATNLYMGYDNTNGQSRINSINSKPLRILTNSLDAIFIDASQRVGIGTTTLSNKLSVAGDIRVQNWTQLGSKPSITTDVANDYFVIRQDSSSGPDIEWQMNGSAGDAFKVVNRTAVSVLFTVSTSGLITATNRITGVSTPTASTDAATKGYVDSVNVPTRWAGYSTTTYDGAIGGGTGGVRKGNIICNSNYSGSHWASMSELMALGSNYPWTYSVWLMDGSSCLSWATNSVSYQGGVMSTTNVTSDACISSYRLACTY